MAPINSQYGDSKLVELELSDYFYTLGQWVDDFKHALHIAESFGFLFFRVWWKFSTMKYIDKMSEKFIIIKY